jgi:dienelactone hydrolase
MKLRQLLTILFGGLILGSMPPAHAETPFIDPMFEFTVEKDLVYAKGDVGHPDKTGAMEMKLDLYRPVATEALPKTLPAMIFIFGGGYKKGSKSIGYIRDLCEHYAKRGYVAAAIDYRLIKDNPSAVEHPIPAPPEFSAIAGLEIRRLDQPDLGTLFRVVNASLQDTGNAIRWLKGNAAKYQIDPTRIGIGGVSAGALNALYAGHSEAPLLGPKAEVAAVLCFMAPPGMEPSLIDAKGPPTFFAHGAKDSPIMIQPYINQLNQAKVHNVLHLAPGLGHRITPILDTEIDGKTIRNHSVDFCFKALKLSALISAAPPSTCAEEARPVHLILLSGQSNMANLDPARVFIPEIEKHFGAGNVVVVKAAQGGQPIRRWFKGWRVTGGENPDQIGDIYGQLMERK